MMSVEIGFERGQCGCNSLRRAWNDECLVRALGEDCSALAAKTREWQFFVAAKVGERFIGQCLGLRFNEHTEHLARLDLASIDNLQQRAFIVLSNKAVRVEQRYLEQIQAPSGKVFRSASLAVLPKYRGYKVAQTMLSWQLEICRANGFEAVVAETTSHHSARVFKACGFKKLKEWSYATLARPVQSFELFELRDESFCVWGQKL